MSRTQALKSMVLLVCLAAVIALTTLPARVLLISWTRDLFPIAAHPNLHDAIGHGTLHALLTAVIYWALRGRVGFSKALPLAVGSVLLIGLGTELLQRYSPGRSVQLSDLLANWLGVMTAAAVIGYRRGRE